MQQYRYAVWYNQRMREQRNQIWNTRLDYYNDPYFYSAPIYRYYRVGRYYEVNQYGANLLRQAIDNGYDAGYRAGNADRQDGWTFSYRNSFAYQDADFGYTGYYLDSNEYSHYFREGFRRGYQDGYYSHYHYGTYSNGSYAVLGNVVSLILNLHSSW